jgi:hypothetical protein
MRNAEKSVMRTSASRVRTVLAVLLLCAAIPAVDSLNDTERYIDSVDRLDEVSWTVAESSESSNEEQRSDSSATLGGLFLRLNALLALVACGFAIVMLWKAGREPSIRWIGLFIGCVLMSGDPSAWPILERYLGASVFLSYGHSWGGMAAVATLLWFSTRYPRHIGSQELWSHRHDGNVRSLTRRCRNALERWGVGTRISCTELAWLYALTTFMLVASGEHWSPVWSRIVFVASTCMLVIKWRVAYRSSALLDTDTQIRGMSH